MFKNFFKIKNYPDDVYNAVGQIIKASQEWEAEYKKLAFLLHVPVDKINKSSLNKLNEALKKNKMISKKDFNDLKSVIDIRNYINHDFFIKDFNRHYDDYDQMIENLQEYLNNAQFLIYEATDLIDNKIDKLDGETLMRRTVFD